VAATLQRETRVCFNPKSSATNNKQDKFLSCYFALLLLLLLSGWNWSKAIHPGEHKFLVRHSQLIRMARRNLMTPTTNPVKAASGCPEFKPLRICMSRRNWKTL
jgi:hypothetical protein